MTLSVSLSTLRTHKSDLTRLVGHRRKKKFKRRKTEAPTVRPFLKFIFAVCKPRAFLFLWRHKSSCTFHPKSRDPFLVCQKRVLPLFSHCLGQRQVVGGDDVVLYTTSTSTVIDPMRSPVLCICLMRFVHSVRLVIYRFFDEHGELFARPSAFVAARITEKHRRPNKVCIFREALSRIDPLPVHRIDWILIVNSIGFLLVDGTG